MRRLAPLDLTGNEIRNARAHVLAAAPSNPVSGQFYYNSGDGTLYYWDGGAWVAAKSGAPSGTAGGDLVGTYPNPTIGTGKVTAAHVLDATLTDAEFAAANKDGAAGVPSLRTLGTGALQAVAGNDARLSNERVPTDGSVTGGTAGTGVKIAAATITDANIAAANKDGAAGTPSMRTLGTGATQAAAGNDGRLSDARTPTNGSVVDASVAANAAIARTKIAAPTGDVSNGGFRLTSLGDPTADTDAANKRYVDASRQGLDFKESVRAATTGNITLSGTQTVDGVALAAGNRVLVKDQTTASANGLYTVAAGAWARASDADASGEISPGSLVYVEEGTANGRQQWVATAVAATPWTPGTTGSTWGTFSSASATTAGAGLTASGNAFAVGAGNGILVDADAVRVDPAVVTRKYVQALTGTGSSEVITHNLGTRDVQTVVYDTATSEVVAVDVENTSTTQVTLRWGTAPGAGYRVVVQG